jgi:DNA glycosylase AlkZ-like
VDRAQSLAELARRYLRGHAPADEHDLAKWAGLPLRDARSGLSAIAPELVQRSNGMLELEEVGNGGQPPPCLLDRWDPLLVGWRSRDLTLRHYPRLSEPETHFHPFAYVGGYAVAAWGLRNGVVEIDEPFARVTRADLEALGTDAADVQRFLSTNG